MACNHSARLVNSSVFAGGYDITSRITHTYASLCVCERVHKETRWYAMIVEIFLYTWYVRYRSKSRSTEDHRLVWKHAGRGVWKGARVSALLLILTNATVALRRGDDNYDDDSWVHTALLPVDFVRLDRRTKHTGRLIRGRWYERDGGGVIRDRCY